MIGKTLLQFGASWCGPCKQISSHVENLAHKYFLSHLLTLVKVDIEKSPDLANFHHIRSVPTFILMDGDKEIARVAGSSIPALENMLKNNIGIKA